MPFACTLHNSSLFSFVFLPDDWSERLEQAQASDLPAIIGQLAEAQATAWARLYRPRLHQSAPPIEDTAHYTADGLATHLNLSKGTVYRLFRAGVWPHAYKVGRTKGLRVPRADVEAWRAGKVERPRFEVIAARRAR